MLFLPALPYPRESLTIPSKPSAPISYTFIPPQNTNSKTLVVYLNGLGLPAKSWESSIRLLLNDTSSPRPALLTYDRYGQGCTTARDPLDSQPGKESGHDYIDVINDLHEIITTIATTKLSLTTTTDLSLFLVCASIGCNISRLYAQHYPGRVAALLLLDSNIASMEYSEIWPDPDAAGFDAALLGDVSVEEYGGHRTKLAAMFDLGVKNAEGLDRANSKTLLPRPDAPKLVGVEGKGPLVTVVGHDPETFGQMSLMMMGTPKVLSKNLTDFHWSRYNNSLREITDEGRCGEVVIAKGCGHFIQKDDPSFVAAEVKRIMEQL